MNILIDELTNDPLVRDYANMSNIEIVNSLNTVNQIITAQFLSGSDIFNATDANEYAVLSETQKASWDALCAIESIDTINGAAKAREAELFGAGTTTRTNLIAIKQSTVSRAQELGIPKVREGHVQEART